MGRTVKRKDVAKEIAKEFGLSPTLANDIILHFEKTVVMSLYNKDVKDLNLHGFGTFCLVGGASYDKACHSTSLVFRPSKKNKTLENLI